MRTGPSILIAFVVLAPLARTDAGVIGVLTGERRVSAFIHPVQDQKLDGVTGTWQESAEVLDGSKLVRASQTSTISEDIITGAGDVRFLNVTGGGGSGLVGSSELNVTFDLATPHAFVVSGHLSSSLAGSGNVRITLKSASQSGTDELWLLESGQTDKLFSEEVVLPTGAYTLRAYGYNSLSGSVVLDRTFNWELTFASAPEPQSLYLLVAGCVFLLSRSSRARA